MLDGHDEVRGATIITHGTDTLPQQTRVTDVSIVREGAYPQPCFLHDLVSPTLIHQGFSSHFPP